MTDFELNVPHGYRLHPGTDLLALAERLRTALAPVRDRIEIEQVAEFIAKTVDAADLAGTPRPESVIFDAVQAQAVHVGQILAGEHSCHLNTVTVAVSDDPETGGLYALMFPRHPALATGLMNWNWATTTRTGTRKTPNGSARPESRRPNGPAGPKSGPACCEEPARSSPLACSRSTSATPTRMQT